MYCLLLRSLCRRVTSRSTVSSDQKPVFICRVCHLKCRVFSVSDVPDKILQVNSQRGVTCRCQTVKIVISKPKLAVQVSKALLVGRPITIKSTEPSKRLWKTVHQDISESTFVSFITLPLSLIPSIALA